MGAEKIKRLVFRFFSRLLILFGKLWFRLTVQGYENLPVCGPCILTANHQSYLDILAIAMLLDRKELLHRTSWVIGKSTSRNPFLRPLFLVSPLIVVNGTVRKAEAELKKNRMLVIFPEGFYAWRKYLFERGKEAAEPRRQIGTSAAILGLKTGCEIVPIGIRGTYEAMPPYSFFAKPGNLCLRIGKPFRFEVPEPEEIMDGMISEKTNRVIAEIDALR
ncbi:MAG: 2-acyl-glycerophospho-ethanolamine acyltransferase [Candidatus Omnitrophica bacterium ADurb.Bin277]|nr:MAG: 2-acyl-glycerophospho-ethanolamine acyltransferase [Candidatus Omnitrophica bacterium ADurb.Bin277]